VELAIKLVLILHFVGLSMLLGGTLYQMREKAKNVVRLMVDGAYTQLVTGIALLAMLHANHEEPNDAAYGVKLLFALVIAVLAFLNRKKRTNNVPVWTTILVLTLTNVVIAVFVHG